MITINESQINPGLPKEPGAVKKEMRFGPSDAQCERMWLPEIDPMLVKYGPVPGQDYKITTNTISDAALKVQSLDEMIEEAKEENKKEKQNMDFYNRLLGERNELQEKIIKLREFMLTPKWDLIDETQKELMEFQVTSMEDYHYFLRQRIALLSEE